MPRTKAFDESEVLDRAVELFRRTGYAATSMQELVDHLGISRSSLYDTFGDKHALYMRALDRYRARSMEMLRGMMDAAPTARAAIRRAFEMAVEDALTDAERRGCLAANATMERVACDPEAARWAEENLAGLEALFARTLERGQAAEEWPPGLEPVATARFLANAFYGLRVVAKADPQRARLEDVVRMTLQILG